MKKLSALFLSAALIFMLCACGESDVEIKKDTPKNYTSDQTYSTTENGTVGSEISRDKAIEIALKHAGFEKTEVLDLNAELDMEMGAKVWEVDFEKDLYEYSYDINPTTGEIIKSEKTPD